MIQNINLFSKTCICHRDGMITSEQLAVIDAQSVGQPYGYYHGQDGIDQVRCSYAHT